MAVAIFTNIRADGYHTESSLNTPFGYTPKLADLISRAVFTCCISSKHVDLEADLPGSPRMGDEELSTIAQGVFELADLGYEYANEGKEAAEVIDVSSEPLLQWARLGKDIYPDIGPNSAQISIICALLNLDWAMEEAKTSGITLASIEALAATTIALYEAAFEAARDPLNDLAIERNAFTARAKRGADAVHVENRQMKEQIFRWCDENMDKYKSMEEATRAADGIVPVTPRTIRSWIGSWNKNKQSASKL